MDRRASRTALAAPWRVDAAILSAAATLFAAGFVPAAAQSLACSSPGAGSGLFGLGTSLSAGIGAIANGSASSPSSGAASGLQAPEPCAPDEPASLPVDGPPTLAGNPVDIVTGAKVDRAIDAFLPAAGSQAIDDAAPMLVSRFYASDSQGSAAFGPGWRMGLETRLHASGPSGRRARSVVQGDGRIVLFGPAREGSGGAVRHGALVREDGELVSADAGVLRWVWRWRNGRELFFDADGRLRRIRSPAGAELALDYDQRGRLSALSSAAGRGIRLRYYEDVEAPVAYIGAGSPGGTNDGSPGAHGVGAYPGRLAALADSGGVIVRYRYDRQGRLARVHVREREQVSYEYARDHPRRLVAVVLPDGRRSEYRYAPDGRVEYSRAAGDGEHGALRFRYRTGSPDRAAGTTTISVDGIVRATHRWTRRHPHLPARLLSSIGPGCPRCPVTGWRYRYDDAGRLVEVLEAGRGEAISARPALSVIRDRQGRPVELRARSGTGWRVVRVAWVDDSALDLPQRIDRPSVVAGREASLRIRRDDRHRAVALEQSGHAPSVSPDSDGRASIASLAVRRESVLGASGATGAVLGVPARPFERLDARTRRWRDDFGRVVALWSADFGLVRRGFDERDRLRREVRADGSNAHFEYDEAGRLVAVREFPPSGDPRAATREDAPASTAAATEAATTRLEWSGDRIVAIGDHEQRESFAYDSEGRVAARRIAIRLESGRVVEFESAFEYDAAGRVSAWSLPGGGWIRVVSDASGQAVSLDWQPAGATLSIPLVAALARDRHGLSRYVYGNGVVATFSRTPAGRLERIRHRRSRGVDRGRDIVDHRFAFDGGGALREWWRGEQSRRHLFDRAGRLLQAIHRDSQRAHVWRFAYDENGNRLLAQQPEAVDRVSEPPRRNVRNGPPGLAWDAAGRLIVDGAREYRWDAAGRLREIRRDGQVVARYRYDHRAQRIAKVADGVATHFLYDTQRQPFAELDADGLVRRQYVYLADRPVAILDRVDSPRGEAPGARVAWRIRYLHLNHLGAPEAVSDERARVIWRAEYAPFGRRLRDAGGASEGPAPRRASVPAAGPGRSPGSDPASPGFELALRLPGQYEDAETGLHYNDHRYYDPDAGRYLSPDPIGLAGGPNPYVYAGNDPLTRIDPSGLLLFAFDGTGNSDPPARRDDWSNVYKLSRSYADGRVWYMSGVGTDDAASGIQGGGGDALLAGSARARVDFLLRELDAAVSGPAGQARPVDVDVIGFSRGAAMARDFSNRVADRIRSGAYAGGGACVRLRFVGLWDTVAQFGPDGVANGAWRLSIPEQAAYAAHAVALNEHRTLFPAESIVGSPLAGVRIERGFVGAHSDVGGSYAEGDLSDVALIWMHAQARHAGVRLFALTSEFARVTAPLLHDSDTDGFGDREFRYRNSWGWTFANPLQRVAQVEGLRWRDTGQFIRRYRTPESDAYGEPTIVGDVDVAGYSAWLRANYGIAVASGR